MTPQSSQTPSTPEAKKPSGRDDVQAEQRAGPVFAKIPIRLEPIRPPVDDERDHEPVRDARRACASTRRAPCGRSRPRSAPSRTCSSVSWIWYGSSRRHRGELRSPRAARALATRRGVKRSSISAARVRLRDLEDVEVRVEVDADRADRRDRLVEHHEPRRQPQVHRVDQPERLADHLQRVDLAAGSSRSSASRSCAARRRTPPRFSFG